MAQRLRILLAQPKQSEEAGGRKKARLLERGHCLQVSPQRELDFLCPLPEESLAERAQVLVALHDCPKVVAC
jgi:hypothetical protein